MVSRVLRGRLLLDHIGPTYTEVLKRQMESSASGAQDRLINKVIDKGLCVACGACVGLCPYFHYFDGKVLAMARCSRDTGRCVEICPLIDRGDIALDKMTSDVMNTPEIGPYKKIIMACSLDKEINEKAQYGGVVSSLITYALGKDIIRSAILTDAGDGYAPAGTVARSRSDVIGCAGSRYTASAGLEALNMAIKTGEQKLGIVGLPCQMEALTRMRHMGSDGENRANSIVLKIGLFCTWALDYRSLFADLRNRGLREPILKCDIPPPPAGVFQICTRDGWREFPLNDIRPFIKKGCSLCQDMTAEWSDISVGAIEGIDEWNTVVLRTDLGLRLMEQATEDGVVKVDDLPKKNLMHLAEASFNKKERGRLTRGEIR